MNSFKVIVYLGLCGFFSVFGCVQNEPEVKVKVKPQITHQKQNQNSKKTVQFGHVPSPLQSTELVLQDFSAAVVSDIVLENESSPLKAPSNQLILEQAIAAGNLLRSPCLKEWSHGHTLNQSIKEGQCLKSVEWMSSVYSLLLDGESLDNVLFKMVSPGPYDGEMEKQNNTVVISSKMLQLEMFHERLLHIESVSTHPVTIIVSLDNESFNLNRECIKYGHNLSVSIDMDNCLKDTISTEIASILQRDSNLPKPVWYLNGYRFSGFQSTKLLSHTLYLP